MAGTTRRAGLRPARLITYSPTPRSPGGGSGCGLIVFRSRAKPCDYVVAQNLRFWAPELKKQGLRPCFLSDLA